jgi:hypothetical protein
VAKTSIKVGLKYCGGCNPRFHRQLFVRDLTASLDFLVEWVSFEDEELSRLLIVCGCETACVDPKEFEDRKLRMFFVSGNEPGVKENVLSFILGGHPYD